MWLQTPLVCCTVDHMFTLKRISGVSPSGAEISVNSWVQIFLPPGCWKAQSQSRGLGSSSGLLSWTEHSRIQAQCGTGQHMQRDREQAAPLTATTLKAWGVMLAASVCAHSLKKVIMLQFVIVKCHFHKVTLNVSFWFFFSSYKTTLEARKVWNFIYTLNHTQMLWKREK